MTDSQRKKALFHLDFCASTFPSHEQEKWKADRLSRLEKLTPDELDNEMRRWPAARQQFSIYGSFKPFD